MRVLPLLLAPLVVCTSFGCAIANYAYSFDLTNPGAVNLVKPGQRDTLEDADIKAEILVDPTSFQAVALDITNKTEVPMQVQWGQISMVAPDQSQTPLQPDTQLGEIEPGAKVAARLVPFVLPGQGPAAAAYNNTNFELVVPVVVRGAPREMRYAMHVNVTKL
jgi:hypothetical protein